MPSIEWLETFVMAAARSPEFVDSWARLRGVRLPQSVLDRLIDHATGHDDAIVSMFIADVRELVCDRLPEPGHA